jgi:hypothetical protein
VGLGVVLRTCCAIGELGATGGLSDQCKQDHARHWRAAAGPPSLSDGANAFDQSRDRQGAGTRDPASLRARLGGYV